MPPHRRSLRDPAGALWSWQGRLLRTVRPESAADVRAFLESPAALTLMEERRLIETCVLNGEAADEAGLPQMFSRDDPRGGLVLEHAVVPFASHPAEWPPEMLLAAAELTLDLTETALPAGYSLKDATPLNVLFRGPRPVFVDVLSFERGDPRAAAWLPYAQFVRTFLLPLLAHRYAGLPLRDAFLGRRDGLEPREVGLLLRGLDRWRPTVWTYVTLPHRLSRLGEAEVTTERTHRPQDPEKARFILEWQLRKLRKAVRAVTPRPRRSPWSSYDESNTYSGAAVAAKDSIIRQTLGARQPKWILDVGANRGRYSMAAAESGASVVSIDTDPAVLGRLWTEAAARSLDILPLVVDFARPTPALGWRNEEFPSFLERAAGRFDGVLMLAVIHHLLVTEGIPLREILKTAAEISTGFAIVEFVPPEDAMFRRIARGRDALHAGLDYDAFESACREFYEVAERHDLTDTARRLYVLERRRES